jgi:hypothetical protein
MAYSIATTSYEEDGLLLSDHLLAIDDDSVDIRTLIPGGDVSDTVVIVQAPAGEFDAVYDMPLERQPTPRPQDAFFSGPAENTTLAMQISARGFARLRVLVGRVRRGLTRFGRSVPCRLCKLALSLILHAVLVSLGIPPTPTGVFDVSAFVGQLRQILSDVGAGSFGSLLAYLCSLLPSGFEAVVYRILQGLNWIFGVTDDLFNDMCEAFGLCPPRPLRALA